MRSLIRKLLQIDNGYRVRGRTIEGVGQVKRQVSVGASITETRILGGRTHVANGCELLTGADLNSSAGDLAGECFLQPLLSISPTPIADTAKATPPPIAMVMDHVRDRKKVAPEARPPPARAYGKLHY